MKIVFLEDDLVNFIVHLIQSRAASGLMNLDDMHAGVALHNALAGAKTVDFSNLGPADLEAIGPGGVKLGIGSKPPLENSSNEIPVAQNQFPLAPGC